MTATPGRKLVSAEHRDEDAAEASLRPQKLSEFVGQEQARKNLAVFIEAARARKEALDHVLFVGPPGLGKTTLAQIVARELGVNFRGTSGPVIAKAGDLAALRGDELVSRRRRHRSAPRRYLFGNRSAIPTTPADEPFGTITLAFGS